MSLFVDQTLLHNPTVRRVIEKLFQLLNMREDNVLFFGNEKGTRKSGVECKEGLMVSASYTRRRRDSLLKRSRRQLVNASDYYEAYFGECCFHFIVTENCDKTEYEIVVTMSFNPFALFHHMSEMENPTRLFYIKLKKKLE